MGVEATLCIGDKCKVLSVKGKDFLVLPEKIKAKF